MINRRVLIVYNNPTNDILSKNLLDKCKTEIKENNYQVDISLIDDYNLSYIHDFLNSKKENQSTTELSELANKIEYQYVNDLIKLRLFELERIKSSDLIIFIFPIINMFCPSKLKAWFELLFEEIITNNIENNTFFKNTDFKDKLTFIISNTTEKEEDFGNEGKYILSLEEILEPITHGILTFAGFSVLQSLLIYNNENNYNDKIKTYINNLNKIKKLYM